MIHRVAIPQLSIVNFQLSIDCLLNVHQCFQQILQVFFAVEFQLEAAFAFAVDDLDAAAQVLAQTLFTLGDVVYFKGNGGLFHRFLIHILAEGFSLADGQGQGDDFLRSFQLLLLALQTEDGSCVTGSDLTLLQQLQNFGSQRQKTQGVCPRRACAILGMTNFSINTKDGLRRPYAASNPEQLFGLEPADNDPDNGYNAHTDADQRDIAPRIGVSGQ